MTDMPGNPVAGPLPNELDRVFGYKGDARYVAFYHSDLGDEVVFSDGKAAGSGNTWAFSEYRRHPAVCPLLDCTNLGYSDVTAEECLIIDREATRASIARIEEAQPFLQAQWPPQPPMTPEQEAAFNREMERLMEEMRNRPIDWDAIAREQREQQTRMAVMLAYLDQCVLPGQAEGQSP
jgi:hypothetical protein